MLTKVELLVQLNTASKVIQTHRAITLDLDAATCSRDTKVAGLEQSIWVFEHVKVRLHRTVVVGRQDREIVSGRRSSRGRRSVLYSSRQWLAMGH
jgi:hypothetical protein